MLSVAEDENATTTWLIRLGSFLLIWAGLYLLFASIEVIGSGVPFIGSLLGVGIAIVTGVVSIVLSFVAMAFAWLLFRPLIGMMLLIIAGGFMFAIYNIFRKESNKLKDLKMSNEAHVIDNNTNLISKK